jgi:hypothetical protein
MREEITERDVFEILYWGCVIAGGAALFVWLWLAV